MKGKFSRLGLYIFVRGFRRAYIQVAKNQNRLSALKQAIKIRFAFHGPSCSKAGYRYPLDSAIGCCNAYPLDSDLSGNDSAIQLLNNQGLVFN